jgi:hypothetical protein
MCPIKLIRINVHRPIRGVNAMAAGAGPAHAMYFTCLEYGKTLSEKTTVIPASVGDGKLEKILTHVASKLHGKKICSTVGRSLTML